MKVTKAKEVLRRYAAGEKEFQNLNLTGEDFRGANLSGANFSGTNFSNTKLHSTKFTNAILTDAKFIDAKCGIQIYLQLFLITIFIWLLGVTALSAFTSPILVSSALVLLIPNPGFNNEIVIYIAPAIHILFFIFFVFYRIKDNVGIIGEAIKIAIIATIASLFAVVTAVSTVTAIALLGEISKFSGFIVVILGSIIIVLVDLYVCYFSIRKLEENDWLRSLTIAFAAIGGTSFKDADLTDANFSFATLKNTDFRGANLTRVRWYKAKMLDRVRPGDTYLKNTQVRQWLIGEGKDKNFDRQDLRGINLQGANLTDASFIGADLSDADLRDVNLSQAKLIKTQLDNTDLTEATLTGACIEDWGLNNQTIFKDVICDYVFLKDKEKDKDRDKGRIPYDENRNFQQGEFSKYVEKALNTVDLIFNDGIDWNTFFASFKNLQDKYSSSELGIQAIEKKPSGAFIIRVEVPLDAVKSEIEASFWQQYKPLLEAKNREIKLLSQQTKFYSQQIENIRKDNTRLIGVIETMAEKENSKVNMTFNASVSGGVAGNVEGNQNVYTLKQEQNLAEAAAEIQKILEQLSQTYPTNTSKEKNIVVGEAVDRIENNPRLKTRVINALKSGGIEAFKEAVNHPLVNILVATIEGWQDAEENNAAKEEILNDFRQAW